MRTLARIEVDEIVADRMCIVTREAKDEAELIRFVRGSGRSGCAGSQP